MDEENLKESFLRVKEDIFFLERSIEDIRSESLALREEISNLNTLLLELISSLPSFQQFQLNQSTQNQTLRHITSTHPSSDQTHKSLSTDNMALYSLKNPNSDISTGNGGVSTDRQTDQQTDKLRLNRTFNQDNPLDNSSKQLNNNTLDNASQILASLDSIKKELRQKIKRLTNQEMHVFSIIYQLEQQGVLVDYRLLASNLHLTESSIRDYIKRLTDKGIPLRKEKLNNKQILVSVSDDLKKIASLETILKLREI